MESYFLNIKGRLIPIVMLVGFATFLLYGKPVMVFAAFYVSRWVMVIVANIVLLMMFRYTYFVMPKAASQGKSSGNAVLYGTLLVFFVAVGLCLVGEPIMAFGGGLCFIGGLSNTVVIKYNGNRMPNPLRSDSTYVKFDKHTRLKWMGYIIYVKSGYASIGDFTAYIGFIVLSSKLFWDMASQS